MAIKKNNKVSIDLPITEDNLYNNSKENYILINESKAKLIYEKHVKNSLHGSLSLTFLGLFISLLITFFTCEFKDIFGISNSSYYVYAVFLIATILFGILTVVFFISWILHRKNKNAKAFIDALKNSDNTPSKGNDIS